MKKSPKSIKQKLALIVALLILCSAAIMVSLKPQYLPKVILAILPKALDWIIEWIKEA
jgi:hypothetical protein